MKPWEMSHGSIFGNHCGYCYHVVIIILPLVHDFCYRKGFTRDDNMLFIYFMLKSVLTKIDYLFLGK